MTRLERAGWTVLSAVTALVLWWVGAELYSSAIPGIPETAIALVEVLTTPGPYGQPFYYHIWKTGEMILVALVISMVVGTVLGVALGTMPRLEDAASAWIYGLLAVPSLVIVFVFGIWFGFDPLAGFVAVPVVITPFVTLNMWEGARNLDPELTEMADFFGAGRWQTFWSVTVPQLVPFLFASVRSGLSIGWKITLLAEAFLLTRGVGFMFKRSFDQYNLAMMVSWLIVFVGVLIVVEYGFILPLRKRVTHWRPEVDRVRSAE